MKKEFENVLKYLIKNKTTITTMESCTSGSLASMITDVEGSSGIFKGGFVTYSNEAKIKQGVPKETIDKYGVYSIETAIKMAIAAQKQYNSDISIGITGTIGNLDKNNTDSLSNRIYYCFRFLDTNIVETLDLKNYKDRHEAKEIICNEIFSLLVELKERHYI